MEVSANKNEKARRRSSNFTKCVDIGSVEVSRENIESKKLLKKRCVYMFYYFLLSLFGVEFFDGNSLWK